MPQVRKFIKAWKRTTTYEQRYELCDEQYTLVKAMKEVSDAFTEAHGLGINELWHIACRLLCTVGQAREREEGAGSTDCFDGATDCRVSLPTHINNASQLLTIFYTA